MCKLNPCEKRAIWYVLCISVMVVLELLVQCCTWQHFESTPSLYENYYQKLLMSKSLCTVSVIVWEVVLYTSIKMFKQWWRWSLLAISTLMATLCVWTKLCSTYTCTCKPSKAGYNCCKCRTFLITLAFTNFVKLGEERCASLSYTNCFHRVVSKFKIQLWFGKLRFEVTPSTSTDL